MGTALAIECLDPIPQEALEAEIVQAEEAYMKLDDLGFMDHVNIVTGLQLPCVREPLRKPVLGRVHRLMAIWMYTNGDDQTAMLAMEASRHAYDQEISEDLLPAEHDLRVRYDAAFEVEREYRTVPEPKVGKIAFDGVYGRDRPDGYPVLVQFFDSKGMATDTLYLGAREPLPNYAAIPRKRNRLLACSGGALGLAGITLGAGWATHGSLYSNAADPAFDPDKLDKARRTTNVLSGVSGLFTGVAIGCGAGALAVGEQ